MARPPINERQRKLRQLLLIQQIATTMLIWIFYFNYFVNFLYLRPKLREIKTKEEKRMERMKWIFKLTMENDVICISELRMDIATFKVLCHMVSDIGGIKPTRNTSIEDVVAMF